MQEPRFETGRNLYDPCILDIRTDNGRLSVEIESHGVRIREWSEGHEDDQEPFRFKEGLYPWPQIREAKKEARCFPHTPGFRQRELLISAARYLLDRVGVSSDDEGCVDDLDTGIYCGRTYRC
jgi:hypothetical protein